MPMFPLTTRTQYDERGLIISYQHHMRSVPVYGSVYATKLSLKVLLYLFPPPAAMTTNCLPVFLP